MSDQPMQSGAAEATPETRWHALADIRDDAVRVVRVRISRAEDAEDHVHEAMLRLAQRPIVVGDAHQLRSLLVMTACGIAVDRHRHAGRQQQLLGRLIGGGGLSSPEDIVADRSEARWLAAGLEGLGAMEQAALVHAMAGHRPGEIARLLGVEYKAAENALGRARRKLRLRATSVVVGVGALLRRLRFDEHPAALTASTLAAAFLLLTPGGGRPSAADHPPAALRLEPALVLPVSLPVDHAAAPAAVVPAGAVSVRPAGHSVVARPAAAPAPTPAPSAPSLPVSPPWQGSPGVHTNGPVNLNLAPGTPAAWLETCAVEGGRWCYPLLG
jgi:DNA-directed RNA polymerase specialized sigma24 family protein